MNKELFARTRACVMECALIWADIQGISRREMERRIDRCGAAAITEMHYWNKAANDYGHYPEIAQALKRHGF